MWPVSYDERDGGGKGIWRERGKMRGMMGCVEREEGRGRGGYGGRDRGR